MSITSIIRFIGDLHGKFGAYTKLLEESPYRTHQVGDMGVGFRRWPHGEYRANPPYDLMVEKGATFHRGNHDNPDTCAKHTQCIPDGTVHGNMMFVGGALSIDKDDRYPNFSWWADEELSGEKLLTLVDVFATAKPEIMVTHECPEMIAFLIVTAGGRFDKMDPRFASRTRVAFDQMFERHQPKLWLFGHWHIAFDKVINGTRFICLPELAFMDIDTDTATPIGDLTLREKVFLQSRFFRA